MTTYGTIPTSSKLPVNLEFISKAKDRIKSDLGTRRQWSQMIPSFHSLGFPSGFAEAISKIKINTAYFRMNYAIIILLIIFLSLLWHPISLIVFIILMGVWLFLYFLRDEPLVIMSRTISDQTVLIVLSVVTIGGLLFTGAILNILVSVLVGVLVVLIHGVLRKTDDLYVDEEGSLPLYQPS